MIKSALKGQVDVTLLWDIWNLYQWKLRRLYIDSSTGILTRVSQLRYDTALFQISVTDALFSPDFDESQVEA